MIWKPFGKTLIFQKQSVARIAHPWHGWKSVIFNDFGTIWEVLELYRAGSRYEPTQGFELTQGFERTRGGGQKSKGIEDLPWGSEFAPGVKICPRGQNLSWGGFKISNFL